MAHYAFIDQDNIVVDVIAGSDEGNMDWEQFYSMQRGMLCKRTSRNTLRGVHYDPNTGEPSADQTKAFRMNYAGIGFKYDADLDAFIPPQPFPSWVFDQATCWWEPPVPKPTAPGMWKWDETTQTWNEVVA